VIGWPNVQTKRNISRKKIEWNAVNLKKQGEMLKSRNKVKGKRKGKMKKEKGR
jgi:hypothetical protein